MGLLNRSPRPSRWRATTFSASRRQLLTANERSPPAAIASIVQFRKGEVIEQLETGGCSSRLIEQLHISEGEQTDEIYLPIDRSGISEYIGMTLPAV